MKHEPIPSYPLAWPTGWPRAKNRKSHNFTAHGKTLSIYEGVIRTKGELERLGIADYNMVVSTNVETRLDGWPRSGLPEPRDTGAAVYWIDKHEKRLCIAIDVYDSVAGNLGAIAATIAAMRAIERHGGAQILARAFEGFVALPSQGRHWREVFGFSNAPEANAEMVKMRYRRMASELHPDREGGDGVKMAELNRARDEALSEVA